MPNKKQSDERFDLILRVFQEYPGCQLVDYLKDGACLQVTVEDQPYTLEKEDGVLLIGEGTLDDPDLTVELNQEACEYLVASEELSEIVTRTRECVRGTHGNCRMSYKVNASPPRMLLKGYLDFSRKMGLL
jgi:hypothetical protein